MFKNKRRSVGNKQHLAHLIYLGLLFLAVPNANAAQVKSVEYGATSSGGEVVIKSDKKLEYEIESNEADQQIVLNLKQTVLSANAMKKIDTSSQEGPVLEVSPYKVEGEDQQARVVIQLKGSAKPEVSQQGNTIRIAIPNVSSDDKLADEEPPPEPEAEEAPPSESASKVAEVPPPVEVPKVEPQIEPKIEPKIADSTPKTVGEQNLDTFMTTLQTKKFTGSPVTIQVRDADLTDVLRLIADASGFNILLGDGVAGKVTLSLVDVPWDQALEVILSSKRLGAERRNNILRIATLASLTTEKEEELRAKQATEKAAPRITRIFPISFANVGELEELLASYSKALIGSVSGGSNSVAAASATIQVDKRTNSLIVQDTSAGLERISKLITLLDVETPQVLIEAKVIEATEQFTKELTGSLGFSKLNNGRGVFGSFAGGEAANGLDGAAAGTNSRIGFAPSMAFLPNLNRLNALLQINESTNDTRVVASPKTVVLNKKSSTIVQAAPVAIPVTTNTPNGIQTSYDVKQANLSLNVTPTVTNTGSVLLELNISRDTVETSGAIPLVAPRNMKTEVLVDSGSTLVIGGVYSSTKNKTDFGFPFLKDLPFVGVLFGGKSSNERRSELLIFVTPRILNERASSVAGGGQGGVSRTTPPSG